MVAAITRAQVLGFRVRAQQLHRETGGIGDTDVLDIGVQDSGRDGAPWALAIRGVDVSALGDGVLAKVWTIRGAPHVYHREDLPSVAAAVAPFSDADAAKRMFDASKPLKAAGIGTLAALDAVAATMRSVVTEPLVKGEVSARLTALMEPPYLRSCVPCDAVHLYEQPFRLAALRAGLELEAGTSPPVLRPIAGFEPATTVPDRLDVIRAYLRLLGPATPQHVAGYLDAPVREVKTRWPSDAVEVTVAGEPRWVLSADADGLAAGAAPVTRLLGPFDLFLQAKDRRLLIDDRARAKAMWPALGRPGAVLLDGDIAGTWRPRKDGRRLRVLVELWVPATGPVRDAITEQAERLAAHRQVALSGIELAR